MDASQVSEGFRWNAVTRTLRRLGGSVGGKEFFPPSLGDAYRDWYAPLEHLLQCLRNSLRICSSDITQLTQPLKCFFATFFVGLRAD